MTGHRKTHEVERLAPVLQLIAIVIVVWMIFVETRPMIRDFAVLGAVLLSFTGMALVSIRRPPAKPVFGKPALVPIAKPSFALPPTSTKTGVTAAALHRVRPVSAAPEKDEPAAPSELIEKLHAMDAAEFQMVIETLFRNLCYRITRRSDGHAGGVDLVIERDGQLAGIQCRQWKNTDVRIRGMREFIDALSHAGIRQGIFITLHGFTSEARELAATHQVEILDATRLANLLKETGAKLERESVQVLA